MRNCSHRQDLELLLSAGISLQHERQAILIISNPLASIPTYVGILADLGHSIVLPRPSLATAGCYDGNPHIHVLETAKPNQYYSDEQWAELRARLLTPLNKKAFDHIVCVGEWKEGEVLQTTRVWCQALKDGHARHMIFEMVRSRSTPWAEKVEDYARAMRDHAYIWQLNGIAIDAENAGAGDALGSLSHASQLREDYASSFASQYPVECRYLRKRAKELALMAQDNDEMTFAGDDRLFASLVPALSDSDDESDGWQDDQSDFGSAEDENGSGGEIAEQGLVEK